MKNYVVNLAGVTFDGRQKEICSLPENSPLYLWQYSVQQDPNCVAVCTVTGRIMGFIPKKYSSFVKGLVEAKKAKVVSWKKVGGFAQYTTIGLQLIIGEEEASDVS